MANVALDGNVTDQNGVAVSGALVYIYDSPGGLADLFDSMDQAIANPVVSGEDGYWQAYVETDRVYTIRYFWGGRERLIQANVIAGDPPLDFNLDPNLRADLVDEDEGDQLVASKRGPGVFFIPKLVRDRLNAQPLTIFDGYDEAAVGTGNDDTAALTAFADELDTGGGTKTGVLPWTADGYSTDGVSLGTGVNLTGGHVGFGYLPGAAEYMRTTLKHASRGVPLVTLAGTCAGISGVDLLGLGSGALDTDVMIHTAPGTDWTRIENIHTNNHGDEAIIAEGTQTSIVNVLSVNALMSRGRAARTGIIKLLTTDCFLGGVIELNASLSALYSTDLLLCGLYVPGGIYGNHDLQAFLGLESCEVGLWSEDGRSRYSGRADLNFGPGVVGGGSFTNFLSLNNSRAGDGLYSGFCTESAAMGTAAVNPGNAQLEVGSGCSAVSSIAAKHKHGVDFGEAIFTDPVQRGSVALDFKEINLAAAGKRVTIDAFAFSVGKVPNVGVRKLFLSTADRTALTDTWPGQEVFDRTLGFPVWRNDDDTDWVDAGGASV